jgi:bifunctional DNA-binding transcriptional regulator/antitoxin component of YhaV-PrlF toxin-antitoxin module
MTVSVKVEKNGKILLPVNVRRILGIREGESDLLLNVDDVTQSVTMETRDQALARIRARVARYIPGGTMLSEELRADRRAEASRE